MYSDRRENWINDLRNARTETRIDAAQQLRRYHDEAVIGALIEAFADTELKVCRMAMDSLASIGLPAVKMLIDTLGHIDSGVRSAAVLTLGDIGDQRVVDALIDTLDDEDEGVQHAAAETLSRIGTSDALAAVHRWQN